MIATMARRAPALHLVEDQEGHEDDGHQGDAADQKGGFPQGHVEVQGIDGLKRGGQTRQIE